MKRIMFALVSALSITAAVFVIISIAGSHANKTILFCVQQSPETVMLWSAVVSALTVGLTTLAVRHIRRQSN